MPSPDVDEQTLQQSVQKVRFSGGNADYDIDAGQMTSFKLNRVTHSIRTPGYRTLPKSQLPINPYYKYQRLIESDRGPVTTGRIHPSPGYSGHLELWYGVNNFGHTTGHIPWEDSVEKNLRNKILGSLNTAKSNLPLAIAEAGKTASLIATTATRFAGAFKALRKMNLMDFATSIGLHIPKYKQIEYGRKRSRLIASLIEEYGELGSSKTQRRYSRKKALTVETAEARILGFAAETWLEYSYGWKPLLMDIHEQAEALATALTDRSRAVRKTFAMVTESSSLNYYDPGSNLWYMRKETEHKRSGRMGIAYRLREDLLANIPIFGLTNPLLVAWELVPYSFVVDWFYPLGQTLELVSSTDGLEFLNGFTTMKNTSVTKTTVGRNGNVIDSGGYTHVGGGGVITARESLFEISRVGMASFPLPAMPSFKDPRSFSHAASAVALLHTSFLGNSKGSPPTLRV